MPFLEFSAMEQRRVLVENVRSGATISEASRRFGVSRPTAYRWLRRAAEEGVEAMDEKPRIARVFPTATPAAIVEQLLERKAQRPHWGAEKIVKSLWKKEPPLCVRTADRIFKKHGLVKERKPLEPMQRFQRENCNELWQIDFKGLGEKPWPYHLLSVLDDRSRFCLRIAAVAKPDSKSVFEALWEAFGEFGLPDQILSDNGDCFNSVRSLGCPTPLQAKLWLLGVSTTHGRARHPQTQGKVERFHGTLQLEYGDKLIQPDMQQANCALEDFRNDYNWERPHKALDLETPGRLYQASKRKRPNKVPEHVPAGIGAWRKVCAAGRVCFMGKSFLAGRGLAGEHVEVREEDLGLAMYFAGRLFAIRRLEV